MKVAVSQSQWVWNNAIKYLSPLVVQIIFGTGYHHWNNYILRLTASLKMIACGWKVRIQNNWQPWCMHRIQWNLNKIFTLVTAQPNAQDAHCQPKREFNINWQQLCLDVECRVAKLECICVRQSDITPGLGPLTLQHCQQNWHWNTNQCIVCGINWWVQARSTLGNSPVGPSLPHPHWCAMSYHVGGVCKNGNFTNWKIRVNTCIWPVIWTQWAFQGLSCSPASPAQRQKVLEGWNRIL